MEITNEEAQSMLEKRFNEYPRIKAIVEDSKFKETIANIVAFENVDASLLPTIENEVLVVLALYTPVSLLAQNIVESTGIEIETAESIVVLVDSLLLSTVRDELEAYEYFWNEELKKTGALPEAPKDLREKLELRPTGIPSTNTLSINEGPKPLTREEVLQSLTLKRTMASDIQSITQRTNALAPQKSETLPTDTISNP